MTKPVVVLTQAWPDPVEAEMAARFELRAVGDEGPLSADEIIERCQGADVLCPTFSDSLPGDLIARLPGSIRLIASYGVGTNHIDMQAARARGIAVTNTPDVVTIDTADLTVGLMIAVQRRMVEGDRLTRSGRWQGPTLDNLLGRRVTGRTLGIVGLGRIGRAVAQRTRAFEMPLLYHSRHRNEAAEYELGARFCPTLPELLEAADVISLHCPYDETTHHLIDAAALKRMKREAILINTGRGPLVDEAALVAALKAGELMGAGLDVYEFEPKLAEGLGALPNVVLLPHVGTATFEAREAMGRRVIANIEAFFATGRAPDAVV